MNKKLLISLLLLSSNIWAGSFEGNYFGVDLSYMEADDIGKEYDLDGTWNLWKQDIKPKGAGLGLNIGHNWIINNQYLVGLEFNYKKYFARDRVNQYAVDDGRICTGNPVQCRFDSKVNQSASLIGKLGYLLNDNAVIYGLGGYTTIDLERRIYDGWDQQRWIQHNKWQDGWTLGIGGEYIFKDNLSLKAEYRYTDLGKYNFYTPAYQGQIEKQKYDQDEISIGLNYYF